MMKQRFAIVSAEYPANILPRNTLFEKVADSRVSFRRLLLGGSYC